MEKDQLSRKLAVILHADVVGSTALVQQNETVAHQRIQAAFKRFSERIAAYNGATLELRGDALLAQFERASDAASAALAFQAENKRYNESVTDDVKPVLRVGISLGEVVIANGTVTGAGVVLAQRLEQLASPGGICISAAIREALPTRLPFDYSALGEQSVKGFDEPVRVCAVKLKPANEVPSPDPLTRGKHSSSRQTKAAVIIVSTVIIAGLAIWLQPWKPQVEPNDIAEATHTLPDKPSIAVLAFDNLSGDPRQEYLSNSISESIITGLSRIPGLFVIARQSSFSYKGQPTAAGEIASELGVQYLIDGSVLKSGNRVRVTARLIDALSEHQLWTEQYDRQWEDIFALQDDITQHVIANIGSFEGALETATRELIKQKPPANLKAYDFLLLGREQFFMVTPEANAKARELFRQSVELEPDYSQGHTWLAWTHFVDLIWGWSNDPDMASALAIEHAELAISLDNNDPRAHWVWGATLISTGQRIDDALAAYEWALTRSPNDADLLAEYGWNIPKIGRAKEAIESIKKAMRLNPNHPDWYGDALIFALYTARRYEEAIAVSQRIDVRHVQSLVVVAGCYAYLDQSEKAQQLTEQVLELNPDFTIEWWREIQSFTHLPTEEHYMDGLRRAGLPE